MSVDGDGNIDMEAASDDDEEVQEEDPEAQLSMTYHQLQNSATSNGRNE
jgi:hypothetical protein